VADSHSTVASQTPGRTSGYMAEAYLQDRDSTGVIRQCFSDLGLEDVQIVTGTVQSATVALALHPSPRLLLVDIGGVEEPVMRIRELAEVCEPRTGVVVIGDRNDIVLYRELKAAGVVEYFFKPLVSEMVRRTCYGILTGHIDQPTIRAGRLVFILGVRGGVGATSVAVNAAWHLAENRQRWVMLLDLDLQSGDAALQLDTTPTHGLREAIEHPERVDKLFLERAVIHVEQRLDLWASLDPLNEHFEFKEDATLSIIENLLHRYRFVFVDLPSFAANQMMQILHMPSTCLLVSDGSLASARDLARWRTRIGPNTNERTTLHLLNKSGGPECLPEQEFIRASGGRPPDFVIPYDSQIAAAANLGVRKMQKCAALERGLAPLLRHLTGEQAKTSRSLIRRIFG
jgi:pilus assembly protein CpaE